MRIQHNIMAMNAYRNYTNNVSAMKSNLEKLSSGYKINRAGDDAAGLAISEKMRAQITGLETAQKNAKDGISLVQTAEGALTEVHDMLNRMVELASMSANGTYDNTTDRAQLQKEMDQLKSEINRIADSANFNGIKLLDGSMQNKVAAVGARDITVTQIKDGQLGVEPQAGKFMIDFTNFSATAPADAKISKISATLFGVKTEIAEIPKGDSVTGEEVAKQIVASFNSQSEKNRTVDGALLTAERDGAKVIITMDKAPSADWATASGYADTDLSAFDSVNNNQAQQLTVTTLVAPVSTANGRQYAQGSFDLADANIKDGSTLQIGDSIYVFALGKDSVYKNVDGVIDLTDITADDLSDKISDGTVGRRLTAAAADNANFKVGTDTTTGTVYLTEKEGGVDYSKHDLENTNNVTGDDTDAKWNGLVRYGTYDAQSSTKGLTLQIGDTADSYNQLKVSIADCHTKALGLDSISIADQDSAAAAIDAIKAAINKVSDVRGTLGATQNRLDHTINNLSVMTENIQDAESTIRDVDVAEEMMAYTKNNILIQSAQAMLAQANQVPQGVLQLLQ